MELTDTERTDVGPGDTVIYRQIRGGGQIHQGEHRTVPLSGFSSYRIDGIEPRLLHG